MVSRWFWFVPSVPGYLREEEEHKPDPWRNPIERNHMGLHLENEVKTPTIIFNNPVYLSLRRTALLNLCNTRYLSGVAQGFKAIETDCTNCPYHVPPDLSAISPVNTVVIGINIITLAVAPTSLQAECEFYGLYQSVWIYSNRLLGQDNKKLYIRLGPG